MRLRCGTAMRWEQVRGRAGHGKRYQNGRDEGDGNSWIGSFRRWVMTHSQEWLCHLKNMADLKIGRYKKRAAESYPNRIRGAERDR